MCHSSVVIATIHTAEVLFAVEKQPNDTKSDSIWEEPRRGEWALQCICSLPPNTAPGRQLELHLLCQIASYSKKGGKLFDLTFSDVAGFDGDWRLHILSQDADTVFKSRPALCTCGHKSMYGRGQEESFKSRKGCRAL